MHPRNTQTDIENLAFIDHNMSSRVFACISAFVKQLPSLSFRELPGSPSENAGLVNLDVVVAYMLAHTATIRLYANSIFDDDQLNRLNAALAIAHLAAALDREEVQTQSQIMMVCRKYYFPTLCSNRSLFTFQTCCSDAYDVLSSENKGHHTNALEFQTLVSFIDRLRV